MTSESQRILFIFSSIHETPRGNDKTGWYPPEVAHPYYVLSPHFTIDFVAPEGPNPPMDPYNKKQYQDDEDCKRFLEDSKAQSLLQNAKHLVDVNYDNYIAIYYLGGRGSVIDLQIYKPSINLAEKFYRSGRLVCAVSHGPAGLANVSRQDGVSIFNGKEATGLSNAEEKQVGEQHDIFYSTESRIKILGGTYVKADNPGDPMVVRSGNLITGQNPASARRLAQEMKEVLQKSNA